ncbi:MAG: peptide chain release factor N(5)-glutamine methyltransferase [Pseudoflavonifractor sp.]|nr:peptide chain release factor N(5)-glutamine methyltransferase [Pseudoflavonifractor sp.]
METVNDNEVIGNGDDVRLDRLTALMRQRLAARVDSGEAEAMVRTIFGVLKGWTPIDLALHRDSTVSGYIARKAMSAVGRVVAGEPLQYVLGETRFYGNTLVVTPAVLIPRPETEELVDMIVDRNSGADLRVLDLCTGSGCIAVSLARALRFASVTAVDLSADALAVARENASRLRVRVDFRQEDVLTMKPVAGGYDIIVSNPPYVLDSERSAMSPEVLDHEPAMALFVPDDDALRFYRAITRYAAVALVAGGRLYFEINPLKAADVRGLLESDGFVDVEIARDMTGRERFACAVKPRGDE